MLQVQALTIHGVNCDTEETTAHSIMHRASFAEVSSTNAYARGDSVTRVKATRNMSDFGNACVTIAATSVDEYSRENMHLYMSLEDAQALVDQLQEVINAPYVWRTWDCIPNGQTREVPFTKEGKVDFEALAASVKAA